MCPRNNLELTELTGVLVVTGPETTHDELEVAMSWIVATYIAATVFGVGVTLADMFGILAGAVTGSSDDDADADGDDADFGEAEDGEDADDGGESHSSSVAHDTQRKRNPILTLMFLLRSFVFFCLGFGPVGCFATTQYGSAGATLAWSVPVGVVVMVSARVVRKLLRKDLTSEIRKEDLLMEKGTVIVSIGKGQMGKVRVSIGGVYTDRFAKASDPETTISTGTEIRVIEATEEFVLVEPE